MSTRQTFIRFVNATTTSLGVELPKPVVTANDRAARLKDAVNSVGANVGALATAFAAAVDAGNDPCDDAGVQRVIAAAALSSDGTNRDVESIGDDGAQEAIVEHADDIVASWRPAFDQAAADLAAARQQLGDVDLSDSATILRQGGDAADVWARAQTALKIIDNIGNGWFALASLARLGLDARHGLSRIADVPPRRWADLDNHKADPWPAVRAGVELVLPTLTEYQARIQAIDNHLAQPIMVIDQQRSSIAGREIRVPAG